jgi:glycosyltransferase involved in cell wall biosynthesis
MLEKNFKVLLISPLPPPAGGIATWTKQYIEWADDNEIAVEIVNIAVIGKRAEKINNKTSLIEEIRRTKRILKDVKCKIKQFKPDVVHLNTSCGRFGIVRDYLSARLAKRNKLKLCIHYHCNIEEQMNSIFSKGILCRLSRLSNANIVLNRFSEKYLRDVTGCESEIIANYIHEAYIISENKSINENINTISFVGHIQKTKGIYEIIEIARHFNNIEFKLAGPVSDEIKDIKIPDNIVFLGQIDKKDVRMLLSESDVFLFPTYTEGFAIALLEAMAMGVPIITTPVGANREMIEAGGGIIINVGDLEGMVTALYRLENKCRRIQISKWNVNKVRDNYTTNIVMNELISKCYLTLN